MPLRYATSEGTTGIDPNKQTPEDKEFLRKLREEAYQIYLAKEFPPIPKKEDVKFQGPPPKEPLPDPPKSSEIQVQGPPNPFLKPKDQPNLQIRRELMDEAYNRYQDKQLKELDNKKKPYPLGFFVQ